MLAGNRRLRKGLPSLGYACEGSGSHKSAWSLKLFVKSAKRSFVRTVPGKALPSRLGDRSFAPSDAELPRRILGEHAEWVTWPRGLPLRQSATELFLADLNFQSRLSHSK